MPPFLGQSRARYPRNAALDLGSVGREVGSAVSSIRAQSLAEDLGADLARGDTDAAAQTAYRQGDLNKGLAFQKMGQEQAAQTIERFADLATMVDAERDPERRAQLWNRVLATHPNADGLSEEERDPATGPRLMIAEAGEFMKYQKGLLDQEHKRAQISSANRANVPDTIQEYEYSRQNPEFADYRKQYGRQGKTFQFDRVRDAAKQLGYSDEEAFDIARGKKPPSEADLINMARQLTEMEMPSSGFAAARIKPEQRRARYEEILGGLQQRFSTGRRRSPRQGAPEQAISDRARQNALQKAREAIEKGASRDAVIQRLRQHGIDPSGL